jgi:hypothetical protein
VPKQITSIYMRYSMRKKEAQADIKKISNQVITKRPANKVAEKSTGGCNCKREK